MTRRRDDNYLLRRVKMEQIREKRTELASMGVDVGLVLGREPWWMKDARLPPDEPFYRDVVVYNRGQEVAQFSAVAFWVEEGNAIDFSRILALEIESENDLNDHFRAVDGESYHRAVTFETAEFLSAQQLLPHLERYMVALTSRD